MADPVIDGCAQVTNLTWVVDQAAIKVAFGWKAVALLNDLEAIAYAIPTPQRLDRSPKHFCGLPYTNFHSLKYMYRYLLILCRSSYPR